MPKNSAPPKKGATKNQKNRPAKGAEPVITPYMQRELERKTSGSDNAISWLIVIAAAVTPLIRIPYADDPYCLPKEIFLLAVTGVILIIALFSGRFEKPKMDVINILLLAFTVLTLFSCCIAVSTSIAFFGNEDRRDGFITLVSYILLFLTARRFYRYNRRHLDFFLITASVFACIGIPMHFGTDVFELVFTRLEPLPLSEKLRPYVTLGNPDFVGAWLSVLLPVAYMSWAATKRWIYLVPTALMGWLFIYVASRSAMVGLVVALPFMLVLGLRAGIDKKLLLWPIIAGAAMLLVLALFNVGSLGTRFLTIFRDALILLGGHEGWEAAGAGRGYIWKGYLELIGDKPWFGYGLENPGIFFTLTKYNDVLLRYGELINFDKAHNEYLHTAICSGIPCLLVYLGFLGATWGGAFRSLWRRSAAGSAAMTTDRADITLKTILLTAVISYLAQAFFNINTVTVSYLLWIALGILASYKPRVAL